MGEWDKNLGVPPVTGFHALCIYCKCRKPNMFCNYRKCSLRELPWEEHVDDFHEHECNAREIRVHVASEDTRMKLINVGRPFYPKGKRARGRALSSPVPELNLRAGDRIEPGFDVERPGALLIDPAKLETRPVPFEVVFWRSDFDSSGRMMNAVSRRNPIFNLAALGTSISRTVALDSLHLVYLGVCARLISVILWRVILDNPWRCRGDADSVAEQARD
jgi:hypothetical protein